MAEHQHTEAQKQPERARTERAVDPAGQSLDLLLQRTASASFQGGRLDPRTLTPQAILALQRTVGNAAVNRLLQHRSRVSIQRETYDEAEQKLDALHLWSGYWKDRGRLLGLLRSYSEAVAGKKFADAYRIHLNLIHLIDAFLKHMQDPGLVDSFLFDRDKKKAAEAEATAIASLNAWKVQIESERAQLESSKAEVIAHDREAGRLLYKERPLTLPEGQTLLQELGTGTAPTLSGLVIKGKVQEALPKSAEREWGLGMISGSEEAVLIPGEADSTAFDDYPYLVPKGHSHPKKAKEHTPERKMFRGTMLAVLRARSCQLGELFAADKSNFRLDLLPSKEDILLSKKRGEPQIVQVHYKYYAGTEHIINPEVMREEMDLSFLPWISFTYVPYRQATATQSFVDFKLTMHAGATTHTWAHVYTTAGNDFTLTPPATR